MPLESATTIEELDSSWPLSGDPVNQGDDHLRLLKSVLELQFPGVDGGGFKIAIIATEDEINYLVGARSNIQDQIDGLAGRIDILEVQVVNQLSAPAGTRLVLASETVPLGWSLFVTGIDDRYLRINNTGAGDVGGNYNWASGVNFDLSVNDHVLTDAEMPPHFHDYVAPTQQGNSDYVRGEWPEFTARSFSGAWNNELGTDGDTGRGKQLTTDDGPGGGVGHGHTSTDNSSSNTSFRPSYFDTVIIEKDA